MWPFKKKKKRKPAYDLAGYTQKWDTLAKEAERDGTQYHLEQGDGFQLGRYERDGQFDYETYRRMQEAGNREKLRTVFASKEFVDLISKDVASRLGKIGGILCHGTRNGTEQAWFKEHFPDADVLGTEISPTATDFPLTIQWDFHEIKDEWKDHWDVVYSNSWDHAYSPSKVFDAWGRSLRPGGLMYLEHTETHEMVDKLDMYGATPNALQREVEGTEILRYVETIRKPTKPFKKKKGFTRTALIFERRH